MPRTINHVRKSLGVSPSQLRTPGTYERGDLSGHNGQKTGLEVSDESNHTLSLLRKKISGQKSRSLI
jgi:hypothetical protein